MTIIPSPDGSRGFSLCVFTPFRNQFFPGVTFGWLLVGTWLEAEHNKNFLGQIKWFFIHSMHEEIGQA